MTKKTGTKAPGMMVTDGTKHPLPAFKPSPPNRPKAPAAPKKGTAGWAEVKSMAITTYIQEHNGKPVVWKDFCKAVGLTGKELGGFLRGALKAGVVSQPDPEKFVYKVIGCTLPKVKAQLKRAA